MNNLNQRLSNIIQKNKETNPKYLENVIKSDFYYLINNYFEVDFNDISVEISLVEADYQIEITAKGDRIKLMKTIPN